MKRLESKRLVLRELESSDFKDFCELIKSWNAQPGPAFDKWPDGENELKAVFAECSKNRGHGCWICLKNENKVIGGIFFNGETETEGWFDVGHIIHSDYQNNDIDREALFMYINHIFSTMENVKAIITNNAPNEKQNAPLYSIGFIDRNKNGGQLIIEESNWKKIIEK